MKTALVAYGSKRGGTADLAAAVADAMRDAGIVVDCMPADVVHDLKRYDAVIVGGALYANRWHKHARRFVKRHAAALAHKPVWLFSSGPLDDSAPSRPPTGQVAKLLRRVGARGHVTFGGRLTQDATGFIASAMAKTRAGDWRDFPAVAAWGHDRAADILATPPTFVPTRDGSHGEIGVALAGTALLLWIVADMMAVRSVTGLQILAIVAALAILVGAVRRYRQAAV